MSSSSSLANDLKQEGNSLFGKKRWQEAIARYTASIAANATATLEDDAALTASRRFEAILYTNKSLCESNLGRLAQAEKDALKAISKDHLYIKAWNRLAKNYEARRNYFESMTCYAQVLSLTSARSLSDAEKAQRESCESSLDIAQQKWRQVRTWLSPDGRSLENGMPWNRILPLIPYYKSRREQGFVENSGFWHAATATNWQLAESTMAAISQAPMQMMIANPNGRSLMHFTGAILMEDRIFRVPHPGWLAQLQNSMNIEASYVQAPVASTLPSVQQHIENLFAQGGFNRSRPAFTVYVQSLVMKAFIKQVVEGESVESTISLNHALEVLDWGRVRWPNASREDRGSALEPSWRRGVCCMRLVCYIQAIEQTNGQDPRFTLEILQRDADALLEQMQGVQELSREDIKAQGPQFNAAFYVLPRGFALQAKAYCMIKEALDYPPTSVYRVRGTVYLVVEIYREIMAMYPRDDERYLWWKTASLTALFIADAPLRETLPLIDDLRKSMEAPRTIWEECWIYKSVEAKMAAFEEFVEEVNIALEAKQLTTDAARKPPWFRVEALVHFHWY